MNPELAQIEALAKDIMRRCMAEEEPAEVRQWITDTLARMGGAGENAAMTWAESFDLLDKMLEEYAMNAAMPEKDRKILSWPWPSWNEKIAPLKKGMLAAITAPDGQGKTIYAESLAEYWASHKHQVVFVHYELNRELMILRRTARHTSTTTREIESGKLPPEQLRLINETRKRLLGWDGCITYLHTPGWTMERTAAELSRLHTEGLCDVVVLDYLEKVAASKRQLQLYGQNQNGREADNVELLKNFAESKGVPVVMVAQMNKAGKSTEFEKMDRTNMRGAGEKSDKANLVILMSRKRVDEGYSNTVDVLIDKNTMGGTGTIKQWMQPEYFRVADIVEKTS